MTTPIEMFRFCPRCSAPVTRIGSSNAITCAKCGLLYYLNPSVAVSAIITDERDRVLLIRRGTAPGKGMLGFVGGFVDFGESAEAAMLREAREEVNVELAELKFFGSSATHYPCDGLLYPVLDLFYTARLAASAAVEVSEEVSSVHWFAPSEIRLEEMAFVTAKDALGQWIQQWKKCASSRA